MARALRVSFVRQGRGLPITEMGWPRSRVTSLEFHSEVYRSPPTGQRQHFRAGENILPWFELGLC